MQQPFKFDIKLHQKKRGNWRPKVSFEIEIFSSYYSWRPKLRGIQITTVDKNADHNLDWWSPSHWDYKHLDKSATIDVSDLANPEDGVWGFYNSPKRGVPAGPNGLRTGTVIVERKSFDFIDIMDPQYVDTDIRLCVFLNLPWRPGAKPDYSDFMDRFSTLIPWLGEELNNGSDSGQNDEVVYSAQKKLMRTGGIEKPKRRLRIGSTAP